MTEQFIITPRVGGLTPASSWSHVEVLLDKTPNPRSNKIIYVQFVIIKNRLNDLQHQWNHKL